MQRSSLRALAPAAGRKRLGRPLAHAPVAASARGMGQGQGDAHLTETHSRLTVAGLIPAVAASTIIAPTPAQRGGAVDALSMVRAGGCKVAAPVARSTPGKNDRDGLGSPSAVPGDPPAAVERGRRAAPLPEPGVRAPLPSPAQTPSAAARRAQRVGRRSDPANPRSVRAASPAPPAPSRWDCGWRRSRNSATPGRP